MPVEFIVIHRERPLMVAHGLYGETLTRQLMRDMQYFSMYATNLDWLKDKHLAEESEVAQEESMSRHSCRRTRAVDDAMMKALTDILMKRYPTDERSQQYDLEKMDDLVWVIVSYIWKMVDNILA